MKAERIADGVRIDAGAYILEIDTQQLLARLDVKDSGSIGVIENGRRRGQKQPSKAEFYACI